MGLGVKRKIIRFGHALRLFSRWQKLERPVVQFVDDRRGLDLCDIIYINLDHREDRRSHLEREFSDIGATRYRRLSAIRNENGALGCAMSHVKALEHWESEAGRLLMICEDDCDFLVDRSELDRLIDKFFLESRFDVLCLAYNISNRLKVDRDFYLTSDTQTASCYVIKGTILKEMLATAQKSVDLLSSGADPAVGAIDIVWKELQRQRIFCVPVKRVAVQIETYSDIERRVVNYGV